MYESEVDPNFKLDKDRLLSGLNLNTKDDYEIEFT